MSSTYADRLTNQLLKTTRKIADHEANRLAHERLVAIRSRKKERRVRLRRRICFGTIVERAGLGEWEVAEVLGVLVEAKDRVGRSPTMRLAARKRGAQLLGNETRWLANYQPEPASVSSTDQSDARTSPQASEQVLLATPPFE